MEDLGLKVGIEFHQMLDTKEKLFCSCPTSLVKEFKGPVVRRRLRATRSELGEVDRAAMLEEIRGREYVYEAPCEASCLVELDEEPPHNINREALEIALKIALALHADPVDEIHVMRKIVIDGSNTTGFQRTALIALGGYIDIGHKKVPIQTICLEEDAARKISESEKEVVYRLDRLGIPLIEIATAPVITSPEEAELVAAKIGQLLRVIGGVKRGLGTIRQDLNISIKGGGLVEIKGVQYLELIPKVVKYEVMRQVNLLKIKEELQERGVDLTKVKVNIVDVTDIFKETGCKIIKNAIKRGGRVLAGLLPGLKGILGREIQPGRRVGTELADYARVWGGVKGIFHSDELPKYGITADEVAKVFSALKGDPEKDAFVIVADKEDKARRALQAVVERARLLSVCIPSETRGANPDGTTHYSRPRPGAARMYPETDIRPVRISSKWLEELKKQLPEPPGVKFKKFVEEYGLSEELANKILLSYRLDLFEKLVKKYPQVSPTLIASTIENILKSLRRDGVPVENITDEHIEEIFEKVSKNLLAKESIPDVLKYLAENPDSSVSDAIEKLGLFKVTEDEVRNYVKEVIAKFSKEIKKRGPKADKLIMGIVMRKYRGKLDGAIIYKIVKEELEHYLHL